MIEGITKHDFLNHSVAIKELLQEIQFVDQTKSNSIFEKIEKSFADYKDFSLFHFTDNRLSGAIFAQVINDFTEIGRTIKIAYMSVRKEYVGQGIAKDLLDYFISTAQHSFANIVLTCYEKNGRGIKFYTKFHFIPYTINKVPQHVIKDQGTENQHIDITFIRRYPLKDITIRPLRTSNIEFLKEMVYQSIYKEGKLFDREKILQQKEIARYYENWDSKKEIGFIVRYEDKDIGAIWCRKLPYYNQGYGYVDDNVPEMGLAVFYEYRGRGLGQLLMDHLFSRLKHNGETAVSLYVHNNNPAKRAYTRNGFLPVRREDNNLIMLKKL
ncbi:GNAT family N-acetyltransferase [Portibacter lacus]|uniref:N-acetyltransferase domain-containing protein n=1 Tax=Portibacter lacus TaxID=1099794 RepID=A0AA37SRT4_9BACT|nr:GNAT family N-acetyltransferase [Portibacter lacus]GLR18384.1 hypothetical protein GCM10007940_30000 [Portibacter lacus]